MAKKHKHEEHENHERWLVSYADFITLLFAFFTVLYALSQSDKAKYQQAAESIQRSFLSAGGVFPLKGTPLTPFQKPPDKGSATPPAPNDAGKHSKTDDEAVAKMAENVKGLFEESTGLSLKHGDIDVYRTEEGFKIRMNERLLYKPGSKKLKRDNLPFLYEIGKRLARTSMKVQIEGHSDNQELSGADSHWQLSLARSYNVMRFLVDGAKFPKDKISVSGYGDTMPIADNGTPEGRAKNRRVEIAVLTGKRAISSLSW